MCEICDLQEHGHDESKKRQSGEAYYTHPLIVAELAGGYNISESGLLAAMLHDIMEDTLVTLPELQLVFGMKVSKLVDHVTRLDSKGKKLKLQDKPSIYSKIFASSEPEAILIKMCDRYHNISTVDSVSDQKRIKVLNETKNFYIPLAKSYIERLQKDLPIKESIKDITSKIAERISKV